jgi:formylmethanofuran dehydrogenase subunit E
MCPGLAIGIRAAEVALGVIGPHAEDEEVVAIVETDMCGVDAIQYFTGCTFGKGNLIHRDHGKSVFTFIRRSDGKAIRVALRSDDQEKHDPEGEAAMQRVYADQGSEADHQCVRGLREARTRAILERPLVDLFEIKAVQVEMPERARIYDSVTCAGCGERTMETRVRLFRGQSYCIPCFEQRERKA